MKVMDFDAALAVVLGHAAGVKTPGVERVSLSESRGRVLAEEVTADRDQPPFDRSTRDGFAVKAEEIAGGGMLLVVGQVRAGEAWRGGTIERGCAVGIMTGAPVPEGLDAVVMVEHVSRAGDGMRMAAGRRLEAGGEYCASGSGGPGGGFGVRGGDRNGGGGDRNGGQQRAGGAGGVCASAGGGCCYGG